MASPRPSARPSSGRRLAVLLAAATLTAGFVGCGDDDRDGSGASGSTTTTSAATPTTTEGPTGATGGCRSVARPEPRTDEPDRPRPRPARLRGAWTVTMRTTCGTFTIRLDTARQPRTTASFRALVAGGFYDGLTFHRIVADYVVQGGDPAGDGTGGPGYSVRETPPADAAYTRGVVAMAKAPDEADGTSGSQFYVVTGADTGLPPQYAIVGRVSSGMDAVDRIAAVGSTGPPDDAANEPVVITKATVRED